MYFNVVVNRQNNTFNIEELLKKPKKNGCAEDTLKKMKYVLTNNMTYTATKPDDKYSSYTAEQMEDLFRTKADEIKLRYIWKADRANFPLFDNRKKVATLWEKIMLKTRPKIFLLSPSSATIGSLMLAMAQKYGYEGSNKKEANRYYLGLQKEMKHFFEKGLLPKRCFISNGETIDIERTLAQLDKLTTADYVKLLKKLPYSDYLGKQSHPPRFEVILAHKARKAFENNRPPRSDLPTLLFLKAIANHKANPIHQLLYDYGAAGGKNGYPLHYGMIYGGNIHSPQVFNRILEFDVDINEQMPAREGLYVTPFDMAVHYGSWNNVQALLDRGALVSDFGYSTLNEHSNCPSELKTAIESARKTQ